MFVARTAVSTLCGYGLAKYNFRARPVVYGLVVGSLLVPSTALVVPLFLLEHDTGLINSYQGVILPLLVYPSPILPARAIGGTSPGTGPTVARFQVSPSSSVAKTCTDLRSGV